MAAAMLRFNRQRANTIIARRHGDSTDAGYESSRRKFKVWMKNYYPEGLTGTNDDLIDDRHIILPLHVDATLTFLGEAERLKLVGENIEQIPADQPPIAVSTMTGIASSISDLYKSNNMVMDETLKNEISKFMKGYRRTINDLKQAGQMSVYEGKRPISSKGYMLLAAYAFRCGNNRLGSMYPHLFTVLCWNLFAFVSRKFQKHSSISFGFTYLSFGLAIN
jgi:hypothetical protein